VGLNTFSPQRSGDGPEVHTDLLIAGQLRYQHEVLVNDVQSVGNPKPVPVPSIVGLTRCDEIHRLLAGSLHLPLMAAFKSWAEGGGLVNSRMGKPVFSFMVPPLALDKLHGNVIERRPKVVDDVPEDGTQDWGRMSADSDLVE